MPLAKIEVRKSRPPEQVQAIIDAIYLAQREALKVPEHDRQIRYIEHKPEHFAAPPGKSDNYTVVEICMFPGRSLDAKRALYQAIVDRLEPLGIPRDEVFIVLHEPPLDNWGFRGGIPASEMDLGFKLNV
ncbi:MAG: tautomerase family protein [Aquabacterium sp.]|uniref:tautomerase family protein n=1 Tax=Aquabacterium sp. TaxID=1872578 RepID=UPI003BE44994